MSRIKSTERITADAARVFEDETHVRLEGEVRANEDASQRIRVITVEGFSVFAVVPGLQANIAGAGFIFRPGIANSDRLHCQDWGGGGSFPMVLGCSVPEGGKWVGAQGRAVQLPSGSWRNKR